MEGRAILLEIFLKLLSKGGCRAVVQTRWWMKHKSSSLKKTKFFLFPRMLGTFPG